tara:strand:- start:381 stop:1220 length:840 start_codon:yes stop_codon:yes gene_type:complete
MFDRVVVSTNENLDFLNFVPIVSKAWNKFFPESSLSIAFVSNREETDDLVIKMKNYGDVYIFPEVDGIPTAGHAKMARYILASKYENEVCMIEDIDTIPLQREYFENRTSFHERGKLLGVGKEVYSNTKLKKNFPASTTTATGEVFKKILNPLNLSDTELVKYFAQEYPSTGFGGEEPDHSQAYGCPFSDEFLMRLLIEKWGGEVVHVKRDVDIRKDWVDRGWWNIDLNKLFSEKYVTCNFLINMEKNFLNIFPILHFIYGEPPVMSKSILIKNSEYEG